MPNVPSVIGRVVATELKPSTPHQFFFWTARSAPVGIGALVRVEGDGRIVYGVVTDAYAYSDLASPLDAVVGAGGDPAAWREPAHRSEIRLFQTAVLRHEPEEPLQQVPLGEVFLASDADAALAEEDLHAYRRLGIEPAPFRRVRYFAPYKPDGVNLNTLRTHPGLTATEPLVWGLSEVLDYAEVLLNRDYVHAKADALLDFL